MSECEHNCSDCKQNCAERDLREKPNEMSKIKKVVAVMSGKGGVGKSSVTAMLAVLANRAGLKTGVLDADITGPSAPRAFGIKGNAEETEMGLFPKQSMTGIEVMSSNLLLENATDPVIWRGPMIANLVKQFWTDVVWGDLDLLFIDMPPGTGDVPLTVFQSIPIDGVIVVTSPQELVSMIVEKAVKMANKMNIPILGLVENMSYALCPDCGKKIAIFGESKIEETAKEYDIKVLGKIPLDPRISNACDRGMIELFEGDFLDNAAKETFTLLDK